ncbi:Pyruvate dehydrogenase protein X component,mitochondrial precursor (Dihydrolipoamide dehydrogenase-binding protein of pyruvate dehydrogenase complex) (Lipoyl-containing pyruvate dehydrogenase complex component X) (E3-binding protein) (E3BP) (proX),putative [Schistosoma mansoni]|uniref:Pyruvate dehydrogenase protein X component,mitochondrial precursor (Dihydrolipoamide dehydrogenase-binding protein of pyruvate dehydrogenase complex) (Lipoyl-containing pyruvate dehydrogenase complex component X) (E3-binding protein) (E3BP) (proX),putative n=1 Tax=Schistosoma mansoni TaxID=6183 RepID=UPI0001A625D6|nr:Pyruvate dehydrogenase protein X component,mitochondrial precursor (Dihydrolipoamide dehydrogenase-binding protein of pyruvate dehydrogenase complex) (Lipoyl-containing pyruvate dehydrogenase complex component X) (E3-binding protein) (E3BP) (proX),putative [Schistosoma mansoni]|eukprot:XP_018646480.1 Pyruvate dehydrogenase protein X component,mitochondrial precursor (Dihydrolipoamide dehydrogenase-binding protein of pyruvate dehydrogenase complex) (Lipoyl-containing pyruvate dehydrogenase complex component X) (E3-binding protein) (E3BP) (proX),putative [Schistosoma mansoni]
MSARLCLLRLQCLRHFVHTSRKIQFPVHIKMPSLSPTMSEGSIVNWVKNEGEDVAAGDVLCEVQTDKAVIAFESDEEGVLAKILAPTGSSNIKVGSLIAVLATPDEHWQEVAASAASLSQPSTADSIPKQSGINRTIQEPQSYRLCSMGPAVRLLLQSHDIDGSQIISTGPHGQLLKGDVLAYIANNEIKPVVSSQEKSINDIPAIQTVSSAANFTDITSSNMRNSFAQRLSESKLSIPHEYIRATARIDRLNELITELKVNSDINFSINDFIVKACALGLRLVPDLNAIYDSQAESPIYLRSVDLSMAVTTRSGLLTPILHSADSLIVSDISKLSQQLVQKARDGLLQPHELDGGSFTIFNLGIYDIREFTTIVNHPQVAILAVGTDLPEACISTSCTENEITFSTDITLTLSMDSRCVSEVAACSFLKYVCSLLGDYPHLLLDSDPVSLLLKRNNTSSQRDDEFDNLILSKVNTDIIQTLV